MKYAWALLIAGIAITIISAARMLDILILQAGIVSAAAGVTALFLNAKRIEAMKQGEDPGNNDGAWGNQAA
jgi:hypothetical protein